MRSMMLRDLPLYVLSIGAISLLSACAPGPRFDPPPPPSDPPPRVAAENGAEEQVVATVNGRSVTMAQLQQPLIEARGLGVLLNLVQLELAKQHAGEAGVSISQEDIDRERQLTVSGLFRPTFEEQERLLEQIEQQRRIALNRPDADAGQVNQTFDTRRQEAEQEFADDLERLIGQYHEEKISRPEFDIVVTTNAHLRKVADLLIRDQITDDAVRQAFRALYGETVKVRDIQLANMQEVAEARRRLTEDQPFDQVAREMSRNPQTAPLGGELPAFSMAMAGLPESFRIAAFGLQVGEVSDPVHADGAYHLIKLEERIEPKAVKFEDVQDSVRQELYDQWVQATVTDLRARLAEKALQTMRIHEPTLREQFARRLAEHQARQQPMELE
jgi:parvulin-like peptidyl-prolyl isomerase